MVGDDLGFGDEQEVGDAGGEGPDGESYAESDSVAMQETVATLEPERVLFRAFRMSLVGYSPTGMDVSAILSLVS